MGERVRLRRGLPPLHALPGGVVVPREDRLLLQELPQGLQGRGAGLSAGLFCLRRCMMIIPDAISPTPPFPPASALAYVFSRRSNARVVSVASQRAWGKATQ